MASRVESEEDRADSTIEALLRFRGETARQTTTRIAIRAGLENA